MEIFCDCSYNEKKKVAGIGLLIKEDGEEIRLSNWIPAEDNNFGEMWAVYQAAIIMGGRKGTIYTDSQTALSFIRGKKKMKPMTHRQYLNYQRLRLLGYKIRRLHPNVKWVKGHSSCRENNVADILARAGAEKHR